jgi:hypothetical protein
MARARTRRRSRPPRSTAPRIQTIPSTRQLSGRGIPGTKIECRRTSEILAVNQREVHAALAFITIIATTSIDISRKRMRLSFVKALRASSPSILAERLAERRGE